MSILKKQFPDPLRSNSETDKSELIESVDKFESSSELADAVKTLEASSADAARSTSPLGIKNWISGQLTRNYGLKTLLLLILIIALICVSIYIFRSTRPQREDPSSPKKLAQLLKSVISEDDYEGFDALFLEDDSQSLLSESERSKLYAEFQKRIDDTSFSEDYLILGNSRGHLYLVSIEYIEAIKQYRIRSVREVPSSLRFFFQEPAGASVDDAFASELQRELDKTAGAFPSQTGQSPSLDPGREATTSDEGASLNPGATQTAAAPVSEAADEVERS